MQFGKIPFLRLLLPLCAGILLSWFYTGGWIPGLLCLIVCLIASFFSFFGKHYHKNILFGIATAAFITGAGYSLHHIEELKYSELDGTRQVFLVRLNDYPEKKQKSFSVECTLKAAGKENLTWHPRGKFLIYFLSDTISDKWKPGEMCLIKTRPIPVKNNGNPCEFDYKQYMNGKGIKYYCFIKPEDVMGMQEPDHRSLKEYSAIAARKMIGSFKKAGLKGDALGLVTALTIGEKEFLEKDRLTTFSRAGVMHVMAVSGLHVGMISAFLSYLLFFMRRRWKNIRLIIILILLWAFAFITGLTPSVMRATLMFSFIQTGTIMKKESNSMNLLLASAFILLVARPSVLFEAGFQLSYMAVLFIILFYEPLYRLLKQKNKIADYLWQMIAVSIVAQAGTFPLTIRLFNSFPLLFLLSNIIIIPISFIIVILAFILFAVAGVAPVANIIAQILTFFSKITLDFTSFISSVQHGVITEIGMTSSETFIITIAVMLLLVSFLRVFPISVRPSLICLVLFLISGVLTGMAENGKEGIIVYNIKGEPVTSYQMGNNLSVLLNDANLPSEIIRHAATLKLKINVINSADSAIMIKSEYKTMVAISDGNISDYNLSGTDLVIYKGTINERELKSFPVSTFIVAAAVRNHDEKSEAAYHSLRDKGAFLLFRQKE